MEKPWHNWRISPYLFVSFSVYNFKLFQSFSFSSFSTLPLSLHDVCKTICKWPQPSWSSVPRTEDSNFAKAVVTLPLCGQIVSCVLESYSPVHAFPCDIYLTSTANQHVIHDCLQSHSMELLRRLAPHPAFLQLCIHACMKHLFVFILTTVLLSHTVAFNYNTLIYQGENNQVHYKHSLIWIINYYVSPNSISEESAEK